MAEVTRLSPGMLILLEQFRTRAVRLTEDRLRGWAWASVEVPCARGEISLGELQQEGRLRCEVARVLVGAENHGGGARLGAGQLGGAGPAEHTGGHVGVRVLGGHTLARHMGARATENGRIRVVAEDEDGVADLDDRPIGHQLTRDKRLEEH
ncbi:hypothetical protein G3I24_46950 [Micromonospora aurantiaca]|nr:hypothetical protein [Micromonospora tulbaghiae]NED58415.1 hypothetical protein [Micromonospora aurantiaca]